MKLLRLMLKVFKTFLAFVLFTFRAGLYIKYIMTNHRELATCMLEIQIMNRHGEREIATSRNIGRPMISYVLCQLPLMPACPDKKPRETQE